MDFELNNNDQYNNEDCNIKQPLLEKQQQLFLITSQPITTPINIIQTNTTLSMSRYRVRKELHCLGETDIYKTSYPFELLSTFTKQEYQLIISNINKNSKINQTPLLLVIIFVLILPCIIITPLAILLIPELLIVIPFSGIITIALIIGLMVGLRRRMIKNLELHISDLNSNYSNKNIRFEISQTYIKRSYKLKLYIYYPPVTFTSLQDPQQ